jgi:hypothetical protein
MFDLNRTVQLVRGALFDAEATWRGYLPEAGDWRKTAFLLTGPLIIASTVLAYLFGLMSSDTSLFGMFRPTILSSLVNIVTAAIAAGVVAFIFSGLAGVFGGKSTFALGLAATTFAFVPGYLGQAVTWIPWIGGLLTLLLFIYSLILLWRIIPIYLEVPEGKRAGHYIVSLLATIIVMFVISTTVGRLLYGADMGTGLRGMSDLESSESGAPSGMFGGVMRQAELMAAAEEDRYTPPSNGRVSEDQVRSFIRVMERSAEMQEEKGERLREIAERAEKEENVSISDFSQMMGGMTDVAGLQTAEIEVVKSAGGNWAEHQWVRESLRTAWIQKDLNDTVAHNYALYQKYEDQLAPYISR